MARKRRAFTVEFKLEAVRLAKESGRSLAQIARELGIQRTCCESGSERRKQRGCN